MAQSPTNVPQQVGRPTVRMTTAVYQRLMHTVGAREPETGGILLGPPGQSLVTEFFLDERGRCTRGTYSPDHQTINDLLLNTWRPSGLDLVGVCHSHPEPFIHLSAGDLSYIRRIFGANPGMPLFIAPIVLPGLFWIRPFVVRRDPFDVEEAVLDLFDDRAKPASGAHA